MPLGRWHPAFTDSLCNDSWHTVSRVNIRGEVPIDSGSTADESWKRERERTNGTTRMPLPVLCVLSLERPSHRGFVRKDDACCGIDQSVTSFMTYRWQRVSSYLSLIDLSLSGLFVICFEGNRILEQTRSVAER